VQVPQPAIEQVAQPFKVVDIKFVFNPAFEAVQLVHPTKFANPEHPHVLISTQVAPVESSTK
jgi:hypothetical protein